MKIILTQTIENLGTVGKAVEVKPGYARNYLFPRGFALPATEHNKTLVEKKRLQWEAGMAKERALAEEFAQRFAGVSIRITAKVSEENRLYGSVTARNIAESLAAMGIEVDKSQIKLDEPIKETGTVKVPVRLFQDIVPEITVEVVAEE
jgi:large subunit ribosomal protein L9